jgi:cell division protein FtsL
VQRLWVGVVLAAVVVAALVLASFPARQILAQRHDTAVAQSELAALDGDVKRLQDRATALETPAETERMARDKLGWVRPGAESYRVIFPPSGPVPLPRGWPFLLPQSGP